MMSYLIRRVRSDGTPHHNWNDQFFRDAPPLSIEHFHPASSAHRPETRARLVHDSQALYARFDVRDRYVKCLATHYQDMVCNDSCVELFVQPLSCPATVRLWK